MSGDMVHKRSCRKGTVCSIQSTGRDGKCLPTMENRG